MHILWWIAVFIALGAATVGFALMKISSEMSRMEERFEFDFEAEILGYTDEAGNTEEDYLELARERGWMHDQVR